MPLPLNNSVPINTDLFSLFSHFVSNINILYSVEMAPFGRFTAEILMTVMIVGMFCVTNIVAQDSEIAPTGQLETGAGFALPVSAVIMCSSVLASLVAFMLQWIGRHWFWNLSLSGVKLCLWIKIDMFVCTLCLLVENGTVSVGIL